jgi:hypothetical protein
MVALFSKSSSLSYEKFKPMAKLNGGLFPIKGKIDGKVFVRLPGGTTYVRDVVDPGTKKDEPALKEHYVRTPFLNNLAAGISNILKFESDHNWDGTFYSQLLKRFRKHPSDNRFLLLSSLKGMNIHPTYIFDKLPGDQKVIVKPGNRKFTVSIMVKAQPMVDDKVNCYCYQLVLLTWNDSKKPPKFSRQYSEWIYPRKPKTELEFSFKREAGVVHWMLCEMKQMGFNDQPISLKRQGMRIAEVGTFNKKDVALLEKYTAEQSKKISASLRTKKMIVRVKAKR